MKRLFENWPGIKVIKGREDAIGLKEREIVLLGEQQDLCRVTNVNQKGFTVIQYAKIDGEIVRIDIGYRDQRGKISGMEIPRITMGHVESLQKNSKEYLEAYDKLKSAEIIVA